MPLPAVALAALITYHLPALAAAAAALATSAYLIGVGPALTEGFDRLALARGFAKIRAWLDLRAALRALFASALLQEALLRQGAEATILRSQTEASITTSMSREVPPITFPTFTTPQGADQYLASWSQLRGEGLIDDLTFYQIQTYATAEQYRLANPPTLAPSLPLTQVEVPGFGAVGVRVAVRAGVGAPVVAAPAPALQPIIIQAPPVTVAPPVVNVAPPNVFVQPAAPPQVTVNAPVDTAPIGLAMAGALPLVGASLVQGLTSQAQNLGHLFQLGRNQCFGGTAGALMGLALPIAIGAFSLKALSSDEGVGGWIKEKATDWIEGAMEQAPYPTPASPDRVSEVAAARLRQALSFGLQAHMWAIMAESNFVLKNLGLPQVAGFLAEMAGFKRVAEATIGEVEKAALATPARQFALRKYRPNIPGLGDLEEMYAKKEIPYSAREGVLGLRQALALWGYSDDWAEVYKEHLWKDPRLGEIIRIGQFFNPALSPETRLPTPETAAWMERAGIGAYTDRPGDWYYAWRAAKGGYDPRDVPVLVETARRAVTRREQTLFLDAITRLARDGFIPMGRARELTREGWGVTAGPFALGDPIEARARAIELQQDYKLLSDTRSVIVMSMSRGLVTRDEARERLGLLGLDGTRVELEVLKATLGMLPGMRVAIERPEAVLEEAGMEVE